ncbi:MAG: hypothetical protein K0S33_2281 [Bacteroidetes bacterium]|jgi:O-antigen/teichoic acid export membrane protein|nr:hypothetical protein [Bacteroidota bacterium]
MGIVQKNALRTTIISYAGMTIGFLNKIYLSFVFLTTEQIGLLNLIFSVSILLSNISAFGTSNSIVKFFSYFRNQERNHSGFLAFICIIAGIGFLVITALLFIFKPFVVGHYIEKSPLFVDYYYWLIPMCAANLMFLALDSLLKSMYKNVITTFSYEIVLRLLFTGLILVYGAGIISFGLFMALNVLTYFIPNLILFVYLVKTGVVQRVVPKIRIQKRFKKIILNFSFFSSLNTVGGIFVASIDSLMISKYLSLQLTGIYTTLIFSMGALQIPYRSIVRIAVPLVVKFWKNKDMVEMESLYKKISTVNLVIGIYIYATAFLCREELLTFFPKEVRLGIDIIGILGLGYLFDMYFGLNGIIFITSKKYRFDSVFTLLMILLVFILNIILIPLYGIVGSAIATLAAILSYNLARMIYVWIAYKIHPFEKKQLSIALIGAVVVLGIQYLFPSDLNRWTLLVAKPFVMGVLFLLPVYILRLSSDFSDYIDAVFLKIFKLLGLKKS